MRKSMISLMFALLWIPCVSAQETTDSIEGLVWKYYVGETYYISRKYFYNLSNRKYYKGHFYYVMHLTIENWNGGYIDSFSRQVICIREDQGKVYVMKDEYLELLGGYSSWKHVGDATYLSFEETEEGELVLYDYNMQPDNGEPSEMIFGHNLGYNFLFRGYRDWVKDGVRKKTTCFSKYYLKDTLSSHKRR